MVNTGPPIFYKTSAAGVVNSTTKTLTSSVLKALDVRTNLEKLERTVEDPDHMNNLHNLKEANNQNFLRFALEHS